MEKMHSDGVGYLDTLRHGDWACALGDMTGLLEAIRRLFPYVVAELQFELGEITRLVRTCTETAKDRWVRVSAHLRAIMILQGHEARSEVLN